jgi:hypothetical protein
MTPTELDRLESVAKAATKYPGYEITREGKVFSTESNWRGYGRRELIQIPNSHGYPRVKMKVGRLSRRYLVHKLIAEIYLPERPSLAHEICHNDGDKTNNKAGNLRWGTRKENAADRKLHGRCMAMENLKKAQANSERGPDGKFRRTSKAS